MIWNLEKLLIAMVLKISDVVSTTQPAFTRWASIAVDIPYIGSRLKKFYEN